MQKADHSGHRSRMKKKFIENGLDVFEPHEVLEMLLYYAVPQRNTNDMAKRLIDEYGSLSAVFDASLAGLKKSGLTEHQIVLLKMIPGVTRRYISDKYDSKEKILDVCTIPEYIADRFVGYGPEEHVFLLLVDKKGREVFSGMIAKGDFGRAVVSNRDIVSLALNYSATSAFIAHNHPSGTALPSKEDVVFTRGLKELLASVGVLLADHYIIADREAISLAESGLI